jgi:hypothetical protein
MSIIQIVVVLLVLALAWWLFSRYVLPHVVEPFRTIIIVVLALGAILWLLSLVGLLGPGLSAPLWHRGP